MLIEFWKITKVMNVKLDTTTGQMPRITFENRSSYVDSNTKKWDDEATKYMMYALTPCIICYFTYSLIYEEHKNWCVSLFCERSACCQCRPRRVLYIYVVLYTYAQAITGCAPVVQ